MSTKSIDARLARIEAAQAATLERDPVGDWRASFRRGDPVDARNAIAGPAWVAMAIQRNTEAEETIATYEQDDD